MNAPKEQPPNYTGLPQTAQQQQGSTTGTNGYPGNQGGSGMSRDAVVYDPTTGQPMLSNITAQRQQIETSLGPVCSKDNGYHTLRMHYTTKSLLFSILIIPYCCGYRGRRVMFWRNGGCVTQPWCVIRFAWFTLYLYYIKSDSGL
ncbi:hypothetical protein [Absidia glauca]|uniref:Uncharacterized protein n=1 Tax=Absidia glauca TaxID=4829 RepID=A0A168L182_ABSGL|nr:hypothetical protein [Absidia glauca]